MEWFKMYAADLRSPEYVGSNPTERATWMSVLGYCVEQENGGRVVGAAKWKDRQWQQTCGVTAREIRSAHRLLTINGDDIIVWKYPNTSELEVKTRREAGRKGGLAKQENASSSATSKPSSSAPTDQNRVEEIRKRESPRVADWQKSAEAAISCCAGAGVPDEFIRRVWLQHDGTTWRDSQGREIGNFKSYVAGRFQTERSYRTEKESKFSTPSVAATPLRERWEKDDQGLSWNQFREKYQVGAKP